MNNTIFDKYPIGTVLVSDAGAYSHLLVVEHDEQRNKIKTLGTVRDRGDSLTPDGYGAWSGGALDTLYTIDSLPTRKLRLVTAADVKEGAEIIGWSSQDGKFASFYNQVKLGKQYGTHPVGHYTEGMVGGRPTTEHDWECNDHFLEMGETRCGSWYGPYFTPDVDECAEKVKALAEENERLKAELESKLNELEALKPKPKPKTLGEQVNEYVASLPAVTRFMGISTSQSGHTLSGFYVRYADETVEISTGMTHRNRTWGWLDRDSVASYRIVTEKDDVTFTKHESRWGFTVGERVEVTGNWGPGTVVGFTDRYIEVNHDNDITGRWLPSSLRHL